MEPHFPQHVTSSRVVPVKFTGDAATYFRLWIVNIFLTIITLGVYSAWATVRNKRYFYGNTSIEGHRFEYLATPLQILKGRALAVGFFAIYLLSAHFMPLLGAVFALALVVLTPWMVNQGLSFNMRMTRYRNVHFSFRGNYSEAFINFVVLPFVSLFTLYLLLPYVIKRIDSYIHNNIQYGNRAFNVELSGGEYYKTVLLCFLVCIALLLAIGVVGFAAFGNLQNSGFMLPVFLFAFNFAFVSFIAGLYQGRIRNHIFNHAQIDNVGYLGSRIEPLDYALLLLTNALAIVFTCGLAYPWAKVRKAHFLAEHSCLELVGDLNHIVDIEQQQQSAFADEAANLFDVDVSLG
ncbi:YjgN family protein [Pseudoalteromonas fenneropenaei]|uniref:YjgN family protein n=1 Tax=Pseudoalteromonas fenneropenaei TaxID=1737459 RepID=A0ABV7CEF6_9GAMM